MMIADVVHAHAIVSGLSFLDQLGQGYFRCFQCEIFQNPAEIYFTIRVRAQGHDDRSYEAQEKCNDLRLLFDPHSTVTKSLMEKLVQHLEAFRKEWVDLTP